MDLFGWHIEYLPDASTLQIESRVTVFEILSLVGFVFALLSLAIAVHATRDAARTRRAEYSLRIWDAFTSEEVQTAYLDIEWGRLEWPSKDGNKFASREEERRVDRLLYLLDELAILVEAKVLGKADIERWKYQGVRVLENHSIQRYLRFLDQFFQENGVELRPHDAARRVFGRGREVGNVES